MAGDASEVMTAREAAEYLGRSYGNFMNSYKTWHIPWHQYTPGGRVLFRRKDLEAFLERTRQAA